MRHKQIASNPKRFAIIVETEDEIVGALEQFASAQKLAGSSFKALGALSHVKLGWFN